MHITRTFTTAGVMVSRCLWLLVIAQVKISTQLCTIEEFRNNRAHDLVHSSETSEVTHNITVMKVIYNCLATSHEIGIYNSMSVSILYIRSDTPDRLRTVRYDILCQSNIWQRTRQVKTVFMSNTTRLDCANCWGGRINESGSDHHCTPCNSSCTGLHQCYGLMASECCNFIDDGHCTDDCGMHREGNSSFHCVCSGYWTGDDCDNCNLTCINGTPKSDCSACQCVPGYGGTTCDTEINECDPNPCQNGGKCTDLFNDYSCTGCAVGYTGKNCTFNIDDCKPYSCLNNGKCVDDVNSYTCLCMAGYSGSKCEIDIDECSDSPCKNGGTCEDAINSYTCTCVAGYTGMNCETEIDECSPNPCQNEGTCTDLINNYTCTCKPLHTGLNCSECAMLDCEECVENTDMAVGECTKCTGAHVLDQGTCNDNCGITNCVVCNVRDRRCTRCKEGYHLSSENECKGKTPDEEDHMIIIIIMSVVVLLLLIAIIITAVVLFYECKKPKKRKSNNLSSSGYNYL